MTEVPRPKVAIVRVSVRCSGYLPDGRLCNHKLFEVDVDRWEAALTDAIEGKCEKCKKVYTLSEYA